MAMAQPVVPFWVTCTSILNGRPIGRPDSVISCAVTGTTPLALAVTSALPVELSCALISGTLIVLMVSRWRFGVEHQPHLDSSSVGIRSVGLQGVFDRDRELDALPCHGLDACAAADLDLVQQDLVKCCLLRTEESPARLVMLTPLDAGHLGDRGTALRAGARRIDQRVESVSLLQSNCLRLSSWLSGELGLLRRRTRKTTSTRTTSDAASRAARCEAGA